MGRANQHAPRAKNQRTTASMQNTHNLSNPWLQKEEEGIHRVT